MISRKLRNYRTKRGLAISAPQMTENQTQRRKKRVIEELSAARKMLGKFLLVVSTSAADKIIGATSVDFGA
jgi:hypothetical protein